MNYPPTSFMGMTGDLLSDGLDRVSVTGFFGALAVIDETGSEVIEIDLMISVV